MVKKKKDNSKKEKNKTMRIATEIGAMESGEIITITELSKRTLRKIDGKESKIHGHTIRKFLDTFETLKTLGMEIIRDKKTEKIKSIIKRDSFNVEDEVRAIKKNTDKIIYDLESSQKKKK